MTKRRHRCESQACAGQQDLERLITERTAELAASNQEKQHLLDALEKNQAALQRFRVALDQSADAIFLADAASQRFIDVNQTACERLGYSRVELLEMGPHDINPHLNQQMVAGIWAKIIASPDHAGFMEYFHQRRDGSIFPVEVRLRAIESEGRTTLVAIARDITERKEQEEKLRFSGRIYAVFAAPRAFAGLVHRRRSDHRVEPGARSPGPPSGGPGLHLLSPPLQCLH